MSNFDAIEELFYWDMTFHLLVVVGHNKNQISIFDPVQPQLDPDIFALAYELQRIGLREY